jgi:hypothetical protein
LLDRHHLWADEPAAPAHLHADPSLSFWGGTGGNGADVERLFATDDPGLFAVVQSSSGLTATQVNDAVARHFPVRRSNPISPVMNGAPRSKLQDRGRTFARLTAQTIFRGRRGFRRARLRLSGS